MHDTVDADPTKPNIRRGWYLTVQSRHFYKSCHQRGQGIMVIVQVVYHIKEDYVEAFRAAVIENAQATVKEPGNRRFEVYQDADDPSKFILFEMFDSAEARQTHFEMPHFLKFRSIVGEMILDRRVQTWMAVHPTVFADNR